MDILNVLQSYKLITVSLTVVILCVCYLKWIYSYWNRYGFKTLSNYYYITGHFKLNIGRKSFVQQIIEFYNATDEPFIGIYFLLKPRLLVRDPKLIQSILKIVLILLTALHSRMKKMSHCLEIYLFYQATDGRRHVQV